MAQAMRGDERARRFEHWLGKVSVIILFALVLVIFGTIGTIVITHQRAMWGCGDAPTALVADLQSCLEPGYTVNDTYLVTNKEAPGVTYIGAVLHPLPLGWPFGAAVWATSAEVHVDESPRAGQLVPLDPVAIDVTSPERTLKVFVPAPDTPRLVASTEDAGARKAKQCADERAGWAQSPIALLPGSTLALLWRELRQRHQRSPRAGVGPVWTVAGATMTGAASPAALPARAGDPAGRLTGTTNGTTR